MISILTRVALRVAIKCRVDTGYFGITELCIMEIQCKTASDNYNYRCVVYICMTPRTLASKKRFRKKKKI